MCSLNYVNSYGCVSFDEALEGSFPDDDQIVFAP